MAMRARVMWPGGGRRELLASAAFTAVLVASILLLPSLLLPRGAGPKAAWPFLPSSSAGGGGGEEQQPPRYPVSFAYLISASSGDAARAARLLAALYHPGNSYLIHLDREAPAEEHRRLAELVSARGVYARAGNVWIVGRPNLVTYRGPTMLTTTLHAVAVLLRLRRRWDWFINLSASDYPLVTQDDMIEAFAGMPRDLNFIQHTSHLGWKIKKRARPVILDTALYEDGRAELLRPVNISTNLRRFPNAFKLYTGSAWTMLSRSFAEYVTVGWDNLPRTLLLYHANIISSPEFYFQTVASNSRRFRNATVNHDLHFIRWDNPPKQHPLHLTARDFRRMLLSGAPFARKFREGDAVLDRIDRDILRRRDAGQFAYGGWCSEGGAAAMCGNPNEPERKGKVKAGAGSRRLKALLGKALAPRNLRKQQCRWSRLMGEREGRAAATADRRSRREQAQQQQQQQAERGDLAPGAGAVLWPSPSPPAPTTPVTTMVAVPPASASPAGNRRRAELTRTLSMVDVCAVCLEEVRERRQRVTRLPCSHKYHSDCVLPWLAIHPDCPCCRALVPSVDAIALP